MLENLLTIEFSEEARRWTSVVFFWSGYAAWVGVIVQTFFRSRNFNNPWSAFCLGWIGVALGPLVVKPFLGSVPYDPISPSGIGVALLFSIAALFMYHIFAFLFKREDEYDDYDGYRGYDERYDERRQYYDGDGRSHYGADGYDERRRKRPRR